MSQRQISGKRKPRVSREETEAWLKKAKRLKWVQARGMYRLDAPGMPLPGPNFVRHAQDLGDSETGTVKVMVKDETKKSGKRTETQIKIGDDLKRLYTQALRLPGFTLPIEMRGGRNYNVVYLTGHIWGQHIDEFYASVSDMDAGEAPSVDGPHPADVMVIGKMPWNDDLNAKRLFVGASGEVLLEQLNQLHVKGTAKWYITNLLKFMPPDGSTTIKASWLKDCLPILHQELRIVRPKYILCLGTDASKALLGSKFGVGYMEGRVIEYTYPVGFEPGDHEKHTSCVMTVIHPANVARDESLGRTLERGLARFNLLQKGVRFDKFEQDIDHRTIETLEELEELCYEVENDPRKKDDVFAIDAEWHGEHPVNKGSYVRTIQFAWMPKYACGVKLSAPGGKKCFYDSDEMIANKRGIALLSKFFKGGRYKKRDGQIVEFRKKRVVGHFFNADLEWLVDLGLDLRDEFKAPLYDLDLRDINENMFLRAKYKKLGFKGSVPAWVRTKYEGGADTGLMSHAIEESASYRLESLAMRYTTVPRYDVPLHDWREAYCKSEGMKPADLDGYGMCPDEVLLPYGIYDADATLRIFYEFDLMLDKDFDGNCCREAFWESQIAAPAVLEIHRNGIIVDRDRVDMLTKSFLKARIKQEEKIKSWSKWEDFNIRSVQHVKEFLFGEELNGKVTKTGEVVQIRPGGAKSLYLQPLIDTSKPPKLWSDLISRGIEEDHSPSTNKMVLSILAQNSDEYGDQVNWIRDYRFLDQVLKTVLRPPKEDDGGEWLVDTSGYLEYDKGLASVICDDGRVRTHMYQTKETGRWSSARPNLQNISKQRDPDYLRLLGPDEYKHKLRSVLRSSPGHLLIESDYVGAELYGMAIMSGDANMIDHATRNQLPENHPNFYDIHSNVAVMAFNLGCEPTKSGLKAINKAFLRIIAKSVIFGIAYGRGAKAIALAAKEQGVKVSVQDAQQVIDTIFTMYSGLVPFFEECQKRAIEERWLCHCFGRFRRFPHTNDFKMEGEFGRQAMNFPIQGMIASAMSRAIAYLMDYLEANPGLFRILLQIHDAILVEAPYENVEFVSKKVIPWAMRKMVPIFPTSLDGIPTGAGPYRLGIESEVMSHWGEKLKQEDADRYGIPSGSYSEDGVVINYT